MIFLSSIDNLAFVTEKYFVFCEVETQFLNNICPLIFIILTSSVAYCCYQKDERANPGNLPTK